MLTLYRRHREKCKYAEDRYAKDCRCSMWCEGTVEGKYRRTSLKTRSWERAIKIAREIEDGKQKSAKPVALVLEAFVADAEARKLSPATLKKVKALKTQISEFADEQGIRNIADFTNDEVKHFREGWKDGAISALKKLERLRSFFRFCEDAGWIVKSPAKGVKAPVVTDPPTLPFSDREVDAILQRSEGRWHTLYLLLLHSGLRIGDAMKLTPAQIEGNKLFLYMQKTRVPVYVPLPDYLIEELKSLPLMGGFYFWNNQGGGLEAATGNARRTFRRICKTAGVKNGHPHRFRDTFAVNLLLKGVALETVSILLGHASIRITQKHYSPWVKSRQDKLETEVMKTWKAPKLVRVK